MNHVGPGGFVDLCACASNILFCCSWGDNAEIVVEGNQVKVLKPGKLKFVDQVYEITFNGQEGLKCGKNIFYITHLGAFRLTERGMELIYVMPGVDIQRDILEPCPMNILMPESGAPEVVGNDIVTGQNFQFDPKKIKSNCRAQIVPEMQFRNEPKATQSRKEKQRFAENNLFISYFNS